MEVVTRTFWRGLRNGVAISVVVWIAVVALVYTGWHV